MQEEIIKSSDSINDQIHEKLKDYNRNFMKELNDYSYHIELDGKTIAGIVAGSTYDTLEIDYLFVDEEYRRNGLGTKLMKHVEDLAKSNGIKTILVNTYSFQAPEFYKKLGYKEMFVVDPCYKDYKQYFFIKKL